MTNSNSKYNVLIVDDMPENIQVISNILYQKGVNIAIAQSGKEALNVVSRNPPDLILLDIIMPEMDGFFVCELLKQDPTTKDIPVIFLTARTQPDDIIRGFELGAVDYVTRPFNPKELLSRVLTHLELKKSRDLITAQNQQLAEQNRELEQLYALKERKSERQYHLLVENVADGIGIIQEETLVFVNAALTSILGFTSDQLIGMNPVDLFHDDYKNHFGKMLEQTDKGIFNQYIQAVCVTADDREIWIEERHSLIEWEGKPAVIMTMRDITARKLRELATEEEKDRLKDVNIALKATIKNRYRFGDIIGKSPAMQEIYELILNAAASDAGIVIYGESGTGKELVAWTIHKMSQRRDKAFAPVNCGAIPDTLIESEFFGHRKGAFTGAHKDKRGFFDHAHGGTLFLDEVGELSPAMQVKLLRALAGGEYTPLGDHTVKKADVRIIAATNSDLTDMVKQGEMREDFYYRINIIPVTLPPLRERREDIPLLIDHFLKQFGGNTPPVLPGDIIRILYDYDWPGNVRELQNALQRYLTTKHLDFIAPRYERNLVSPGAAESTQEEQDFHEAVKTFEKQFIFRALDQNHWHRTKTAAMLGISRRSLFRLMEKYGLI